MSQFKYQNGISWSVWHAIAHIEVHTAQFRSAHSFAIECLVYQLCNHKSAEPFHEHVPFQVSQSGMVSAGAPGISLGVHVHLLYCIIWPMLSEISQSF